MAGGRLTHISPLHRAACRRFSPWGLNCGGDLRAIAIVQSIRVVVIAVGLPAGLSALGLVGHAPPRPATALSVAVLDELAILVAVSSVVAVIAYRFRFPGGLLFGAMMSSAILHGTGMIHAVMPWWVANTAMVAMGAVTGSRFANTPLRLLLNFITAAFGSFAVAVAIAALFAAVLISMLSLRAAEVMIAFAPGSVDAMMLLALALNLDPVYVGAHHLARIFFVSLICHGRAPNRALSKDQERHREAAGKAASFSGLRKKVIRPRPRAIAAEGQAAPMCP